MIHVLKMTTAKKRIYGLITAVVFAMTLLPLGGLFDKADASAAGTSDSTFSFTLQGDGTETSPYKINTKQDLENMRDAIAKKYTPENSNGDSGKQPAVSAHYKLTADIESLTDWTPICASTDFEGTFDGNGHKISFSIDGNTSDKRAYYLSLFGKNKGTIKNLRVSGTIVNGGFFVGLIAGTNGDSGTIENCYAEGSVKGAYAIGGIAGINDGTIKNCFADVTSSGSSSSLGAISGTSKNSITNSCYKDNGLPAVAAPTGDAAKTIVALSADDVKKGKAAWILRQNQDTSDSLYWGQKLSEDGKEDVPSLKGNDDDRVFKAEFLLKTTDTTVTVAEEYANNDGHFTKPKVEYDKDGQTAGDKWYTDEKLETEYNFTEKVTQDIQLYSSESLKDYTITLDVGNGTLNAEGWTKGDGENTYTKTYNKGTETFELPTPTAPKGEKFAGWQENGNSGEQEKVTITTGSTGDKAYTAKYRNAQGPVITATLDSHVWTSMSTGENVYVNKQTVKVEATVTDEQDKDLNTIYYYISDDILTAETLKGYGSQYWIVYQNGVSVSPANKTNRRYVYFKATDKDGNVTYVSTAGIVFDLSAPTISGITNGATYCERIEFTVNDVNLSKVDVGGQVLFDASVVAASEDGGIVAAAIGDNKFTAKFDHDGSKEVTITVTDKAGNETIYKVTINGKHIKGMTVTEMRRAASCINIGEGTKLTYCKVCNCIIERDDNYTEKMTPHSWSSWTEVSSKLCGDTTRQRRCRNCGLVETETEGGSHKWAEDYTIDKEPTCINPGYKSKHCTVCGISNPEDTVPVGTLAHQAGDVKTKITEATCTEEGQKETTVYCVNCMVEMGTTYETIPAKGHVFSEWAAVETNNPESTTLKRVCQICGYSETKTDDKDHNWDTNWTIDKAATCTSDGSRSHHCLNGCGSTKDSETIPAMGHKPQDAVREAVMPSTCTDAGRYNDVIYCDTCNERISSTPVTVPALGHTMGEWEEIISQSTGEVNEQRKCEVCGYTETRGMDLENHKWNKESTIDVEPTCTTGGSESIHCSVCGLTKPGSSKPIPAKGHTWGEWKELVSPDCDDSGAQERECTVCSTKETKNLSPNGHTWEDHYTVDKAVTCLEDGSESIHCTKCDAVKESRTIPALGHHTPAAERKGAKAATPTEDGYTGDVVCEVCDEVLEKGEVIPATMGTLDVNSETGEGAPALKLSESDKLALEDAALTAEEKEALSNGADIDIILSIDDATATVTDNDKTLTDTAIAGKYTLGQFINIEITKKINGKEFAVTQLGKEISLTIVVPDSLKAEGRTYAIVRIHDGEADILSDIDSDEDTITFKTDKFSVYAIVYTDKAATPPTPDSSTPDSSLNDNSPATGGDFSLVFMILAAAVLGAVCVIRKENKAH